MTGRQFADLINSYQEAHSLRRHDVGVVKTNPDQSKHLETAILRIHDRHVDFVHLRSESYAPDSRIPDHVVGYASTPW